MFGAAIAASAGVAFAAGGPSGGPGNGGGPDVGPYYQNEGVDMMPTYQATMGTPFVDDSQPYQYRQDHR